MRGARSRPLRTRAPDRSRVLLLSAFVAVAAFANTWGNGFAFDDEGVIVKNPAVTSGDPVAALSAPWWTEEDGDGLLWRPLTLASFAAEWRWGAGSPAPFHMGNVLAHAAVTLTVVLLLWPWVGPWPSMAGALVFAVHPVHVEAVANGVGRAELYAALAYLGACFLYLRGRGWVGGARVFRLLGIGALYLAGLMAKEIAITLPLALLLLETFRGSALPAAGGADAPARGAGGTARRLVSEAPVFLLLATALLAYLGARTLVLGSLVGEVPHPAFQGRGAAAPFLTGLSLWPHYVRLMLFPLDLSVDYDPAVLFVHGQVTEEVLLGATTLVVLAVLALGVRRSLPALSFGILWFMVAVLPVSHLVLHPSVLLAERTLYLPSVGLAWVVAGAAPGVSARLAARPPFVRRAAAGLALAALALLFTRTAVRNTTWFSTYTVMEALTRDHPESVRAQLARGAGLWRVGALHEASEAYELALRMVPLRFGTLVEAARLNEEMERYVRSEELLRSAVAWYPGEAQGHEALVAFLLRRRRGLDAHRAAVEGLRLTRWDAPLLGLLSESYVLVGDLPAAVRARSAALATPRASPADRERLEELLRSLPDRERADHQAGRDDT